MLISTYRVEKARALADGPTVSEEAEEESDGSACDQHIRQLIDHCRRGELLYEDKERDSGIVLLFESDR